MDNFFTGNKTTSSNYSRTYSKGKSFKFSVWNSKDTYNNDEFIQDFVQWNQKLWAAKKTSTNIPPTQGEYWELIVDGVSDVEFKQEGNRILWKYEDDLEWKDLFELASVSEDQIKKMLEDLDIKYKNTYDVKLSETSTNAVQNQAVTKKFKELDEKNIKTDTELTNIKSSVNTTLSNSKSYTDSKISETKNQIDSELNKKINQTDVNEIVDVLNEHINIKVNKVPGKGLSTNDFNDNYKSKLDNLDSSLNNTLSSAKSHTTSEITKVDNKINSEISRAKTSETNLSNRIDDLKEDLVDALKEAKEYTDSLANDEVKSNTNKINVLNGTGEGSVIKTVKDEISNLVGTAPEKLDTLQEIADYLEEHEDMASGLVNSLSSLEQNKVDKVPGKGLSTEDYTTEEKNKLAGLNNYDDTAITSELSKKVDKELNKGLSSNDFTTSEKEKLASLKNYDDTALKEAISKKADKDGIYPEMSVGQSANLLGVSDGESGEFLFRPTDGDGSIKDGIASIERIEGNSVVWNQLYNRTPLTTNGMTMTIDGDTTIINGVTTTSYFNIKTGVRVSANKMLMVVQCLANPDGLSFNVADLNSARAGINVTASAPNGYIFYTGTYRAAGNALGIQRFGDVGTAFNNVKIVVSLYDLTQMFGAGNEPTTIEEFYARIPMGVDLSAYNEGEVINMCADSIKTVGFNAWDEEWELGSIGDNSGTLVSTSNTIRSKNYIKVIGGNEYYFGYFGNTVSWGRVHYYDAEKKWIGSIAQTLNASSFIPPLNCAYMKFRMGDGYGTPYKNDICIHLVHTGYRNGEYEPYVSNEKALPIADYFPNGMNAIGDVKDELTPTEAIQRIGEVDLGTLDYTASASNAGVFYATIADMQWTVLTQGTIIQSWLCAKYNLIKNTELSTMEDKSICASSSVEKRVQIKDTTYTDAVTFKAAMSGVMLYYELAEPIVTKIDTPLVLTYPAWDFGTEEIIADTPTTPFRGSIIYEFNARDTIRANKTRLDVLEPIVAGKIDKKADDYYPQLAVGLADNLSGVDVVDSEINFRRSGGGAISDGVARIEAIKGNSVVWNQKFKTYKGTISGVTTTQEENGLFHSVGVLTANYFNLGQFSANELNHKYLFIADGLSASFPGRFALLNRNGKGPLSNGFGFIFWDNTDTSLGRYVGFDQMTIGDEIDETYTLVQYDLTQMFGAGNEPTTIEEFYARIPMGVDLSAYNEGEVIHMDVQSIESQGVNAWDEEWRNGHYASSTGVFNGISKSVANVNPIKILPNSTYVFNKSIENYIDAYAFFYDDKMNFISYKGMGSGAFTSPSNAVYMNFYVGESSYGATYNHDICINISDASINGKYFPYIKRVEDLSIIRKYFPNGMKSAGTAHDEIRYNKVTQKWEAVKRIGVVDMGTLNYFKSTIGTYVFYTTDLQAVGPKSPNRQLCSIYTYGSRGEESSGVMSNDNAGTLYFSLAPYTDAASFKAAMQGVLLYYELAEPIVTELDAEDQFKDLDYQVWNCGTEKAIAEGKSAPLAADITYGFNAIGKIKELEEAIKALQTKVASL